MCKEFFNYLEIAGKYDVPEIMMTTNAILMTPSRALGLVKSRLTDLHVSVDGATRETYERIRVGARFETLIKNLKSLKEIKKDMGRETPRIQFQFVLLPENLHEAAEIVPLLAEFEPDMILYIHKDYQDPPIENRQAIESALRGALRPTFRGMTRSIFRPRGAVTFAYRNVQD